MSILPESLKLRHKAEGASADLPALMMLAEKAVTGVLQGEHTQRKAGQGEKFWQFREYVPGDRPQDIDWRQSAKTDHIYVRQKEWQTPQTCVLWCNQGQSMDFTSSPKQPSKLEATRILTLAMAILMTRAGEQAALFGNQRAGRTELSLQRIGESLCANTLPFEDLPDPYYYKLPRHCTLIQIGDFLAPLEDTESVFRKLSGRTSNGLIIQVLDPAEIELPYSGRYVFEEPGTKSQEQINHVDSIKIEYQKRISAHIEGLQHICRDQHWSYILHSTDSEISDTLAKIWGAMSHRSMMHAEAAL